MTPKEWKIDAQALVDGSYVLPAGARVWKQHGSAVKALEGLRALYPDMKIALFNVEAGWVIVNAIGQIFGQIHGKPRKNVWFTLIPSNKGGRKR